MNWSSGGITVDDLDDIWPDNVRKSLPGTLLAIALMMSGCSAEFRSEDYEAGPNGEPPKVFESSQTYTKQFVADQKNYVLALGNIHAFLLANDYHPLYPSCFDDVLDIRVTADIKRHKARFPCVALQAKKGAPTKAYLSVTVEDVMFNQLDRNNRLIYTVSMFGREDLAKLFASNVEPELLLLYARSSSSGNHVAP
jgi:hypothetical protein